MTDKQSFKCNGCGNTFKNKESLNVHTSKNKLGNGTLKYTERMINKQIKKMPGKQYQK